MVRICVLAAGLFLCVWIGLGQQPAFEAASIKPNASGQDGTSIGPRGDRLVATNATLSSLLNFAYAPANGVLLKAQIAGAPDWASVDRFDIQAKLPGNAPGVPISQIRLALQALLADRFQLKVHHEDRVLPVYDLIVIKRGPTLSADQTPPAPSFIQFSSSGEKLPPLPRGAMRIISGVAGTTLEGSAIPIAKLVSLLQGQSDRIIFDKTAFTGLFDLHLEFTQPTAASQTTESSAPSLFTAIQDIGLKLESAKAPIEVFVIDSVRKPSGN